MSRVGLLRSQEWCWHRSLAAAAACCCAVAVDVRQCRSLGCAQQAPCSPPLPLTLLPPCSFPGRKDENWWLVVGDTASNSLLAIKRVTLQVRAAGRTAQGLTLCAADAAAATTPQCHPLIRSHAPLCRCRSARPR